MNDKNCLKIFCFVCNAAMTYRSLKREKQKNSAAINAVICGGANTLLLCSTNPKQHISVRYAVMCFQLTIAKKENTAPVSATENRKEYPMKSETFDKLFRYQTVMAWVRSLLDNGIISGREYTKIDTMMLKKYGISSCSIFR